MAYFFAFFYILVAASVELYAIPAVAERPAAAALKRGVRRQIVTGFEVTWVALFPVLLSVMISLAWVGPVVTAWFGGLLFGSFAHKWGFVILFLHAVLLAILCSQMSFASRETWDFIIVTNHFAFWIYFLFASKTVMTFIFFIEVLSALIFLMAACSAFATSAFFNNLNLEDRGYSNTRMPTSFLQALVFFFWVSLLSSLNLFMFLILLYLRLASFDWWLFESVLFSLHEMQHSYVDVYLIAAAWLNFLFCVFLKCGLAPFYFWKPVFFRGLPIHALMFYITFFYFFLFSFFIWFFLSCASELFYVFAGVSMVFTLVGAATLCWVLAEAFYIKAFLALSSILNTLFIFLALAGIAYEPAQAVE